MAEAPPCGGGWGATIVELTREIGFDSPEWTQTLEEGARAMGMCLNGSQIARFGVHAKELMAWNRFANLTAITDPVEIAVKQILDTLPVLPFLPPRSWLLDIGSGGGFPGIPLKILRPDLHLTLIDASRKKVNFQKYVIRTLGLKNVEARNIRAEELKRELQPEPGPYDVIVSKAVSKLDSFLHQAIPLLRRSGIMIAMKGKTVEAELEAASLKIETEGLVHTLKKYRLPHLDIERCLIILSYSPDALKAS